MDVKKTGSMSLIFGVFLFKIVIGTILAGVIPVLLLYFLMMCGYVLPANYSDIVATAEAEAIEHTDDLFLRLESMPGFIHYLVYDADDTVLQTDMDQIQQKQALTYVQSDIGQVSSIGNSRYIIVERETVSILLQYTVEAHYVSKALEEHLPSPDVMMIVLMFLFALLNSVIQVRLLAKKFKRELQPLMQVTDEISKQNLDCVIPGSKVKEIEEILKSFLDMKEALKDSLQKQWESQRAGKEQVAALTHDLKTPMTVTLGNLDLLCETKLDSEQKQLLDDAKDGLEQMSEYIGLLTKMTMADAQYQYRFASIQMTELLGAVCRKAEVLCQHKGIGFRVQGSVETVEYTGDYAMLQRAFMNIVQNAVEHTPKNGEICLSVKNNSADIKIEITDTGKGFSEKMLKQGTQLFAMEDESRSGEKHYGMGLYFVDSVIKKHKGELILSNDAQTGGAKIIVILHKINKKKNVN